MKTQSHLFLLSSMICCLSFTVQAQTKTIELFNGANLDGWGFILEDPNVKTDDVFKAETGVIHITGNPFGYMYTEGEFTNFYLHAEWRWPEKAGNSGIFLYMQDERQVWSHCIECQLFAGNAGDFIGIQGAELAEFTGESGQKRTEFPKKREDSSEKPIGEWNNADIVCIDGVITVYINGVFQNKGISLQYKSGHIALQSEGGDIQFRNIRVTPL
jgi:hypothetical protein